MRKREGEALELLGLLPLVDNIRWDTPSAVQDAVALGVAVKMTTGDAKMIAEMNLKEIGLGHTALRIADIRDQKKSDGTLDQAVKDAFCFCEVFPEDKITIVQSLKNSGHVVAITGDGVNDAPSLRIGDCGIAVEGSSEKAQSAANIVFLTPGIPSIIAAIATARRYFRLLESFLAHRTAVCINLIAMMFQYYRKFGKPLHPEFVFLYICIDDTIQAAFVPVLDSDHVPIQQRPSRLGVGRLWKITLPLAATLAMITAMLLELQPLDDPDTASWVLYLTTSVMSHWSFMLLYTGGRPWLYSSLWKGTVKILGWEMTAALLCIFIWPSVEGSICAITGSGARLLTWSLLSTLSQLWLIRQSNIG
jgi:H+-transporting ATPase